MPVGWSEMSADEQSDQQQIKNEIEALHTRFAPWKEELKAAGIYHRLIYSGGSILENIQEYMSFQEIDYVFIGSHGKPAGRYDKWGTHAEQIVKAVKRPVLIAKDTYRDSLDQVIFASNFEPDAQLCFRTFVEMIKPFNPHVHLLNIDTPSFFKEPKALVLPAMKEFKALADGLDCTLHFRPDSQIERGILLYSEEIDADMIALAQYSDRIFQSGKLHKPVRRLIQSAGLPLILIDLPGTE